jgi:hypothetical protein
VPLAQRWICASTIIMAARFRWTVENDASSIRCWLDGLVSLAEAQQAIATDWAVFAWRGLGW